MSRRFSCVACLAMFTFVAGGCVSQQNASFSVTNDEANRVLKEMRDEPKPLERPLVVLAGFCDPGIATTHLTKAFRRLTGDTRVIGVSFLWCGDFDACRKEVIAAVDKAFPSDDPNWTTEVDVVGVSMGGLVGRYSAIAPVSDPDARRLRMARLFTIGTPHRGAAMATMPTLNQLQIDMRADSLFLRRLDAAESSDEIAAAYEVVPYVRLGDAIVGAKNAAPHGMTPHWVPGAPFQDSHTMAITDARIIADVARRLRGEAPFAQDPPQPLPGDATNPNPDEPVQPDPAHARAPRSPHLHGTSFALQ